MFPLCSVFSKLEKILNSDEKLDTKWKYVTGEWFYEAKSRRHMDKIHGSEIILASMKQRKAPLGVCPRMTGFKLESQSFKSNLPAAVISVQNPVFFVFSWFQRDLPGSKGPGHPAVEAQTLLPH